MDIPLSGDSWDPYLTAIATRFNREAGIQMGEPQWELPDDLKSLPFSIACQHDHLLDRLGVPFHQLRTPKKREVCLDIGCGVSFLIYPWSHWEASFFGHELSPRIVKLIQSRAPQLNSKLFKSMQQGSAHNLERYAEDQFDWVIATGFLYYFPLTYFELVWQQIRRVLKPNGQVMIDVVDPDSVWAEEWGLIELFKGTEPFLLPLAEWESQIKQLGGKIAKQQRGELFVSYLISLA